MSMSMGSAMTPSATNTASSAMSTMGGMSGMGIDMGADSSMAMMMNGTMMASQMFMVFYTSTMTPLYSMDWMPNTDGQYAGTCIFLIIFAALFRGILAIRSNFDVLMRRFNRANGGEVLRLLDEDKDDSGPGVRAGSHRRPSVQDRPWRINEALARAGLDTLLAGVSYLLMLAVMTMNVGYFLSVLGGVFLGSFVIGGYAAPAAH